MTYDEMTNLAELFEHAANTPYPLGGTVVIQIFIEHAREVAAMLRSEACLHSET